MASHHSARFFVGIDWARKKHRVCIMTAGRKVLIQFDVAHSVEGYRELVSRLRKLSGDNLETVAVAIETPRHPAADVLLEVGAAVYAINPRQAERFRERRSLAGAKDDPRDAFMLAHSLQTDMAAFRRVTPLPAAVARVRAAFRAYVMLKEEFQRECNRLEELVLQYAPQLLQLTSVQDPCLWDLLDLGLDPALAVKLRPAKVRTVLLQHNKRALTSQAALAALRAPRLILGPGVAEGLVVTVSDLTALLRVIKEHKSHREALLGKLLNEAGDDAAIIDSLPGAGVLVTAALLSEAHDAIARRDLKALRINAGTAPVTRRSGRSLAVNMRRACNEYLRNACFYMADTAVRTSPWARALYQEMRAHGLKRARALRGVADRLLTRLVAMLNSGSLYDEARATSQRSSSCPRCKQRGLPNCVFPREAWVAANERTAAPAPGSAGTETPSADAQVAQEVVVAGGCTPPGDDEQASQLNGVAGVSGGGQRTATPRRRHSTERASSAPQEAADG